MILLGPDKAKAGFGSFLQYTVTMTKKPSRFGVFLHAFIF